MEATGAATHGGNTESLAAHDAGEERRGWRRHIIRGRSGIYNISGGGQPAQDVIRVRNAATRTARETLRRQEANNLPTYAQRYPFRRGCVHCGEYYQK
jgi:hypothetical protein